MADFSINDTTRRVLATGNGSTTSFSFSFQVNAVTDIKVYVDGTLRTQGSGSTNYAVQDGSGSAGLSNTGTGAVVFVTAPSNNTTVTILSDIPLSRSSLYTSGGNVTASALENDFDTITMALGDAEERDFRSIKAPVQDPIDVNMTLPAKASRVGKLLGFNETTGNPEVTFTTADGQTLSNIASDIATLADLQDGTTATNGLSTLASISSNITTVAGIGSSNITTVATNATAISTNATNITAIQNASTNATKAENYAIKTDGAVESSQYSSKAWAIGGTGVTDTAGSGSAKEWATDTSNTCDGTEYSAKEYAIGTQSGQTNGSAKQWAVGGGAGFATNTAVAGGLYSAKYYAELASSYVDSFDDTYLGAKSSDPSADNDGDALTTGDLYFNTSSNVMKVYNGSSWQVVAQDTSSFATNGFAIAVSIAL